MFKRLFVYIFFLYIVFIFTSWFDRIAEAHSSRGTAIMKWLGIVNVITSIISTIGSFILTSLTVETHLTGEPLNPNDIRVVIVLTILGIAGILLIIGIGLKVITGIILYTKSNELENCPKSSIT